MRLLTFSVALATVVCASDWPGFRGPNGTGVSPDKGLPALLYHNILYILRKGGILLTLDPESGRVLREERIKDALGDYFSQPVAGDGKIYIVSKDGAVSVIRAGADWQKLSSAELDEQVMATPAIAGGRIYLRTAGTLYCFAAGK